ncbi:MAG: hypothetical protein KAS40_18050, partial [Desulfobacterales bacterium]|nr:hypothetical protein [Desulfobacterales bacterium]
YTRQGEINLPCPFIRPNVYYVLLGGIADFFVALKPVRCSPKVLIFLYTCDFAKKHIISTNHHPTKHQ